MRDMPSPTTENPVRPLPQSNPQQREPNPPRLLLGAVLLALGGLVGWVAASLGGGAAVTTTAPPTTASEAGVIRDTGPLPTVTWTAATSVPTVPSGFDYAGTSTMVEIDGITHVIVNFQDSTTGEVASELWQSTDGLEWSSRPLVADEPVEGFDLAASGSTLLMTGRGTDELALYRSIPGRVVGGSSWFRVELATPTDYRLESLTPIVNGQGDVLVMAVGYLDIWRDVIGPHLPTDIDLTDPRYVLREDGVLFETRTERGVDYAEVVPVLSGVPELVATEDSVWIHLVTAEGEEVLQTVPLPRGAYPTTASPSLNRIPLVMAWISAGDEFLPVTSSNALPWGLLFPQAWGDGFVAANYDLDESFGITERPTLWVSSSGRAWQQEEEQPPRQCGPAELTVSGRRMHLTADDGTQCVRDLGSSWEVLPESPTVSYTIGGPAGFVGYPDAFAYDQALFSRDGVSWVEIEVPGPAPYPTLSILRDRLVAMSVDRPRPDRPSRIEIWVGEIDT